MTLALAAVSLLLAADPKPFELDGNMLKTDPVLFETGKAELKPESDAVLEHVKAYLEAKSYISTLRVEVHSDTQGAEAFNQKLTEARAAAVVTALVKKGVSCARLVAVGFGSTKPVAPNDTADGRAQNRRTVFVNAALRGKAIGGAPLDGGGVVAKVQVCL
jgi:OmpA-OmpF porin, OOP family